MSGKHVFIILFWASLCFEINDGQPCYSLIQGSVLPWKQQEVLEVDSTHRGPEEAWKDVALIFLPSCSSLPGGKWCILEALCSFSKWSWGPSPGLMAGESPPPTAQAALLLEATTHSSVHPGACQDQFPNTHNGK